MSDPAALEMAVQVSTRMLEAARAGDWEGLDALENKRRRLLEAAFEGGVSGTDAPLFAELAQRILMLDRELIAFGEQERLTVAEALAQLRAGRQARQAYTATS